MTMEQQIFKRKKIINFTVYIFQNFRQKEFEINLGKSVNLTFVKYTHTNSKGYFVDEKQVLNAICKGF